ncbi:bifunctional 4-hydroxy-2-oxoglutarate aldolase/2-dehydro-3-deoxy-phosphogluconate aldolase [Actinoplanes xinjiangensis]|uniref:2-dehydro-3-deoxyphosphogluconate aldolase/(4S)-4-hydroxy-2-oxoglutarate aldolase n=1 Tax=Actinoplanes xinjiangensis TaxID=512350 RepID=A0A316GA99_9ACTN|nr:bifunctional 4-hydroxy-2-oxoglutarate aldolase/2-dehydro-3-deoxy-phosphogluconate aldolase [Actinoplanes xinjiangensis]PWK51427.1 2-dehydro-3-deoxyphosphogluconate aldolase/(4S)-4-hydroxy-2-oxoglutarate aldolase [Actinoplanes xinjiangensis]GIF35786.1 2-keto-3-deoxy-phosphogluconate aldolase [Actinoplanes xinjiangensis]
MTDQLSLDPVSAAIAESGLVAVLRAPTADALSAVADVLVAAGVTALEVTLTTHGALEAISALRRQLPDTVVVGAGTVLTGEDAKAAIDAGAAFLVSPVGGLGPQPVPSYPGAFSPTEVYAAHRAGAPLIKLFPAGGLGPGYLKDLRGPLPDVKIMPTGGIGLDDIGVWLRAGAVAVGVGGPLIGDAATGGSLTALAARARRAVDAVASARS